MSLMTDVKTLLSSVSPFIGSMPATPDNCIALYNSGGYPRGSTESKLEYPTFMVKIRNASYATGITQGETIKDILHDYVGGKFLLVTQMGDINDIGRDESNRQEWTLNFKCIYKR